MAKEKTKERKKRSKRKERKVKRKQDGGLFINPLGNTARAREGAHARRRLPCTCSYAEAGESSAEIVANCFPHCAKDFALWAWYCRHFDHRLIINKAYYYASCHRQGEVRDGVSAFQAWLRKEYGKKPEAGSGTASRTLSEFINSESAVGTKGLSTVVGEATKAGGAR